MLIWSFPSCVRSTSNPLSHQLPKARLVQLVDLQRGLAQLGAAKTHLGWVQHSVIVTRQRRLTMELLGMTLWGKSALFPQPWGGFGQEPVMTQWSRGKTGCFYDCSATTSGLWGDTLFPVVGFRLFPEELL